jgi:cobalamin biosynthesis protein CobT
MQTIKAVVGVLRNKHQEILIAQRRKSQQTLPLIFPSHSLN